MRLYLMRHGYAEPGGAKSDEARTLTPHGEKLIQRTAATVARMDLTPLRLFCSPRTRAQQTATYMGEAMGISPEVREAVNFTFSTATIAAVMEEFPDDDLMFVGHEPTLSTAIEAITGARVVMKPGSIVCMEVLPGPQPHGDMLWFMGPDVFMAIEWS